MRYIIKRDNSKEKFDDCKISNAIQKALDVDFYHTFNCVLPDTNVILHQDGERQAVLGNEFRLLGLGTHKVTGTLILSRNGFVDLNYVHIRHHDGLVYEFCTKRRSLTCTAEHRLPAIRDGVEVLLKAESIKQGDRFIVSHNRCSWEDARREDDGTIISVTKTRYKGRVFDVTTGDHYFVANNIVSHNCSQIPLGNSQKLVLASSILEHVTAMKF